MSEPLVQAIYQNDLEALTRNCNPKNEKQKEAQFSLLNVSKTTQAGQTSDSILLPAANLTLLHIAAYANATECFLFLLNEMKIPIDAKSAAEYTPFHYACLGGAVEVVSLLVKLYPIYTKNPNALQELFEKDYEGTEKKKIPYIATVSTSVRVLNIIFENGYNFEKYKGPARALLNQPIDHAIKSKSAESLKVLLRYIKPSKAKADLTPIMLAIINNQNAAIPILLQSNCNPSDITKDNKTALYYACFQGNEEAVRMLTDVLFDVDIPYDIKSSGAVHWACQSHNYNIVELIISKGINVNRLDENGRTGPFYILDVGNEDENLKILKLLVQYGFNINYHPPKGNTILGDMLTGIKKPYKLIEYLLQVGADANVLLQAKTKTQHQQTIADFMKNASKSDKRIAAIVQKYLL